MMENEFDRIVRDAKFAYDLMEQNREMERFVNESLILASGNKQAINEMAIIHEAAAGDKIKSFFEKIKNFFKKIFDKLGASMAALFKEQKDYIDKYANICVKCKWNVGDVSDLYDIFTGLPRIISVVDTGDAAIFGANEKYFDSKQAKDNELKLSDFETADSIKTAKSNIKPVNAAEENANAYNDFIKQGYWAGLNGFDGAKQNGSDGKPDINKTFQSWFQGSADTITIDGNKMEDNFHTCINVCYAGQSYLNKLEKIVTTVNKKMDDAQKSMEDYYKTQKEKILTYAKSETGNTHKETHEIIATAGDTDGKFTVEPSAIEDSWYNDDKNKANADDIKNKSISEIETYLNNLCNQKCIIKVKAPKEPDNLPKWDDIKGSITTPVEDGTTHKWKVSYNGVNIDDGNSSDDALNKLRNELKNQKKISESFNIYRDYKNYFNELTTNTKASNADNTAAKNSIVGGGNTQNTNASNTNTNLSNKTANTMTAQDNITVQGGTAKEAEELLNIDITNRQTVMNANIKISTTIASCAFNAFKYINKECFEAIKAHVQWYLSNPGAENDAANQTSRTRSLEMNVAQPAVTSTNTSTNTAGNNGGGDNK